MEQPGATCRRLRSQRRRAAFSRSISWYAWKRTAGPDQIRRVDRRRAVTLSITPPNGQIAWKRPSIFCKQHVEPALVANAPRRRRDQLLRQRRRSRHRLDATCRAVSLLAIIVLYLLMSGLFRSFVDSLLVICRLAAGDRRRRRTAAHHESADGPADHDRVHYPARPGGQQRHPAGAPDAHRRTRRPGSSQRRRAGRSPSPAADPDEHPDQPVRHAAIAADTGPGYRGLSGTGSGYRRRHVSQHGIYADFPAELAAAGRNRRISVPC